MRQHDCLMIPGPVELEPDILALLNEPLQAHYGDEWVALYNDSIAKLQKMFQTNNDLFLMPGPGTLGVDACMASSLGQQGHVLVLSNGFFGHRLQEMAQAYTPHVTVVEAPWGAPLSLDEVETIIRQQRPRLVAMVHCETSTCMLNPVEQVGNWCRNHGALFMVDAISSFGSTALPLDDWGVDLCISSTQKALGCPPGLALVSVSEKAWNAMDEFTPMGWYQNLKVWQRYAEDWGHWFPHPATQNSGLVRTLQHSAKKILDEGLEQCFLRHVQMRDLLRNHMRKLGLGLLIPDEAASPSVTAVVLDERIGVPELMKQLKQRYHILIGGGLGTMAENVVRIGHMGPQAKREKIDPVLNAFSEIFSS